MAGSSKLQARKRFGVGLRLRETLWLFRRHFLLIFGLAIAIGLLLPLFLTSLIDFIAGMPTVIGDTGASAIDSSFGGIAFLIVVFTQLLLMAMTVLAFNDRHSGRKRAAHIRMFLALRRMFSMALAILLVFVLFGFAQLAFLMLGFWVLAVYAPLLPIVVVEGAGLRSLERAAALTRGYRAAIAGFNLTLLGGLAMLGAIFTLLALRLDDATRTLLLPYAVLLGLSLTTITTCAGSEAVYRRLRAVRHEQDGVEVADVFG